MRKIILFILAAILLCSCSHMDAQNSARFGDAYNHFTRGEYGTALSRYRQIITEFPEFGDRAHFEMGIIHSHPTNPNKDYGAAQQSFRKVLNDYPDSSYRKESELMLFNISNVILKDKTIAAQQKQIEALRFEAAKSAEQLQSRQRMIVSLERDLEQRDSVSRSLAMELLIARRGKADKVLIEKGKRRLTLFSRGRAVKIYKIALGGDPNGPKIQQGDNKTPEGIYTIDSRQKSSRYHISLHISYPNQQDKRRASQLGVSPGGNIMIHGIKTEMAWVGNRHAEVDWTQGCIAVTDEEIEEIDRLVPDNTVVEIKP